MVLLRSLMLSLATAVALSGCVLPGGAGKTARDAAPGDIAVTALPGPGEDGVAGASGVVKPKARPGSEAAAAEARATVTPAAESVPTPAPAAAPEAAAGELAPLEEAPPAVVKTPGQIACEKGKGRFVKAGNAGTYTCVRPTRDGGKRCTKAGNCQGVCLARSQTCSPYTPIFGCQEILQDDGLRVTECIE